MSGRSLLQPLKHILRSPSVKQDRCDWCKEQFKDHATLADHIRDTQRRSFFSTQECLPACSCDWCGGQFTSPEEMLGLLRDASRTPCPRAVQRLSNMTIQPRWQNYSALLANRLSTGKSPVSGSPQNPSATPAIKSARPFDTIDEETTSEVTTLREAINVAENVILSANSDGTTTHMNGVLGVGSRTGTDAGNIGLGIGNHGPRYFDREVPATVDFGSHITKATSVNIENFKTPPTPPELGSRALPLLDPSDDMSFQRIFTRLEDPSTTYSGPSRFNTVQSSRTFVTARTTTSTATYRTAPSFSHRQPPKSAYDPVLICLPTHSEHSTGHNGSTSTADHIPHHDLVKRIMFEAAKRDYDVSRKSPQTIGSMLSSREYILATSPNTSLASMASDAEEMVGEICNVLFRTKVYFGKDYDEFRGAIARLSIDFIASVCAMGHLVSHLDRHFRQTSNCPLQERDATPQVFSSEWLDHLRSRGLILHPRDELDWSGRGQHVEYSTVSEKAIPLKVEGLLGHSATAVVESVMCRRIRLARKKIRCTRPLHKVDYIAEVEHLHRLQHAHILRVVGTYTHRKDLAILLYPVAPWNLDEFMDELLDTDSRVNADVLQCGTWRNRTAAKALRISFGCLTHALAFIHSKNVKHMDIKPKNILVRPMNQSYSSYKIYIADFGIARSYKSANDAETDSPISFTRTYAAPEVVQQDTRGFSADIFSLGCVFLEMLATLVSKPSRNERQSLSDIRTSSSRDSSYYANLDAIQAWYQHLFGAGVPDAGMPEDIFYLVPRMIEHLPDQRPAMTELSAKLSTLHCSRCDDGPEPFEAADQDRQGHK